MKSLLFILITISGIQLGLSQYPTNKILRDTIVFNNELFKQLDNKKSNNPWTFDRNFKIDSTQLFRTGYYKIKTNVVFYNKTEKIILISDIRGGSNHFTNHKYVAISQNEQKSIIMTFGFRNTIGNKLSTVYSFILNSPNRKNRKLRIKHTFEIY